VTNSGGRLSTQDVVTVITEYIRLENVSVQNIKPIEKIGACQDEDAGSSNWLVGFTNEQELA
jgi:hypothetical protein